jgi:hypothetical protein
MSVCDTDTDAVFAVFGVLRVADPDVMDADQLVELTSQVSQLKSWCDALQVRATRRQRKLAAEGRADDPRNTLSRHGRTSSKDARNANDREQVCSTMPGFEDALAQGAIAAGHVDAVANATRNLDEQLLAEFHGCADDLLTDALGRSVDGFERNCRDLARSLIAQAQARSDVDELDQQRQHSTVKRWVDKSTGMCHTHLEIDPVRDRALWAAINNSLATLRQADGNRRTPWPQLEVDAVIAAIGGSGDRVPEITVIIDRDTLFNDAHVGGICETDNGVSLPVSTVRRLCCDAEILPAVLNGDGEVLDVGRSKRTATRAQRRALRVMHAGCAHPECTVTFEACRIHHVDPWQPSGDTDIDNLLPLCETHHHTVHEGGWTVHEGGWTLTMTSDRVTTWHRPDGTHHHTGPTINRTRQAA